MLPSEEAAIASRPPDPGRSCDRHHLSGDHGWGLSVAYVEADEADSVVGPVMVSAPQGT